MQCSNVTIRDDAILEGTETLTLQLSTSSPRVEITNSTATVIIQDDDSKLRSKLGRHLHLHLRIYISPLHPVAVELRILQPSYTLEEGSSQDVCVALNGQLERNISATLSTVEGTARGQLTARHELLVIFVPTYS